MKTVRAIFERDESPPSLLETFEPHVCASALAEGATVDN